MKNQVIVQSIHGAQLITELRPPRACRARIWMVLGAALVLAGCATSGNTHRLVAPLAGPWQLPHESAKLGVAPPAGATTLELVVLRPAGDTTDKPVNLYLNNRYVTSLLPSGYTRLILCPGTAKLAAMEGDAQLRHQGRLSAGQEVPLQAGYRYVYEVQPGTDASGRAQLVQKDVSESDLGHHREQAHAVNRSKTC